MVSSAVESAITDAIVASDKASVASLGLADTLGGTMNRANQQMEKAADDQMRRSEWSEKVQQATTIFMSVVVPVVLACAAFKLSTGGVNSEHVSTITNHLQALAQTTEQVVQAPAQFIQASQQAAGAHDQGDITAAQTTASQIGEFNKSAGKTGSKAQEAARSVADEFADAVESTVLAETVEIKG